MIADRYAEVAVPLYVRQTYTYRLPAVLAERAAPGCRVLVPVRNKIVTGYIVAVHDEPGDGLSPARSRTSNNSSTRSRSSRPRSSASRSGSPTTTMRRGASA